MTNGTSSGSGPPTTGAFQAVIGAKALQSGVIPPEYSTPEVQRGAAMVLAELHASRKDFREAVRSQGNDVTKGLIKYVNEAVAKHDIQGMGIAMRDSLQFNKVLHDFIISEVISKAVTANIITQGYDIAIDVLKNSRNGQRVAQKPEQQYASGDENGALDSITSNLKDGIREDLIASLKLIKSVNQPAYNLIHNPSTPNREEYLLGADLSAPDSGIFDSTLDTSVLAILSDATTRDTEKQILRVGQEALRRSRTVFKAYTPTGIQTEQDAILLVITYMTYLEQMNNAREGLQADISGRMGLEGNLLDGIESIVELSEQGTHTIIGRYGASSGQVTAYQQALARAKTKFAVLKGDGGYEERGFAAEAVFESLKATLGTLSTVAEDAKNVGTTGTTTLDEITAVFDTVGAKIPAIKARVDSREYKEAAELLVAAANGGIASFVDEYGDTDVVVDATTGDMQKLRELTPAQIAGWAYRQVVDGKAEVQRLEGILAGGTAGNLAQVLARVNRFKDDLVNAIANNPLLYSIEGVQPIVDELELADIRGDPKLVQTLLGAKLYGPDGIFDKITTAYEGMQSKVDDGALLSGGASAEQLSSLISYWFFPNYLSDDQRTEAETLAIGIDEVDRDEVNRILSPIIDLATDDRVESKNMLHYLVMYMTAPVELDAAGQPVTYLDPVTNTEKVSVKIEQGQAFYPGDADIIGRAIIDTDPHYAGLKAKIENLEAWVPHQHQNRLHELEDEIALSNSIGAQVAHSVLINAYELATLKVHPEGDAPSITVGTDTYTKREVISLYGEPAADMVIAGAGYFRDHIEHIRSRARAEGMEQMQPIIDDLEVKLQGKGFWGKIKRWKAARAEESAQDNDQLYIERALQTGDRKALIARAVVGNLKRMYAALERRVTGNPNLTPAEATTQLRTLETKYLQEARVAVDRL